MRTYRHTDDIAAANRAISEHWFEPDTLRFFSSRLYGSVHYGRYFISSEVPWGVERRRYTIRVADEHGHVDTVGEAAAYHTYAAASKALDKMIEDGTVPSYADGIIDARQSA